MSVKLWKTKIQFGETGLIHSCDDVHELVIVLFVMFFVSSVVVEMNPILL